MAKKQAVKLKLSAIDGVSRVLGRIGRKFGAFGSKMRSAGQTMTQFVSLPAALAGAAIIKVGADFELGMNRMRAVAGLLGKEHEATFQNLRTLAKKYGRETVFSTREVTTAMNFLAQAGLRTKAMTAALPHVLDLAAISGGDLGLVTDQLTDIMTGYGKKATDIGRINDLLVATFTSSTTNIDQLADAFKFFAPIARANKIEMGETAALLGILADSGIKASLAGTGLRRVVLALVKAASKTGGAKGQVLRNLGFEKKDIINTKGQVTSLIPIIQKLRKATPEQLLEVFGIRGIGIIQALTGAEKIGAKADEAISKYRDYLKKQKEIGKTVATEMMKGAAGAIKRFISALEALAITIGETGVLKTFTDLTNRISAFIRGLEKSSPKLLKMATVFVIAAGALGPLLMSLGLVALGISSLLGPVGLALLVMAAIGAVAILVWRNWDKLGRHFQFIKDLFVIAWKGIKLAFSTAIEKIKSLDEDLTGQPNALRKAWEALAQFFRVLWAGITHIFSSSIGKITKEIEKLRSAARIAAAPGVFLAEQFKRHFVGPLMGKIIPGLGPPRGGGPGTGGQGGRVDVNINLRGAGPGTTIKTVQKGAVEAQTKVGKAMPEAG